MILNVPLSPLQLPETGVLDARHWCGVLKAFTTKLRGKETDSRKGPGALAVITLPFVHTAGRG